MACSDIQAWEIFCRAGDIAHAFLIGQSSLNIILLQMLSKSYYDYIKIICMLYQCIVRAGLDYNTLLY